MGDKKDSLLENLDDRLAAAPRFGLNARALILQAAALGHDEDEHGTPPTSAGVQKENCKVAMRADGPHMGVVFCGQLPVIHAPAAFLPPCILFNIVITPQSKSEDAAPAGQLGLFWSAA
jgi:hypothetical protein